ncbi:MAG: hypothetical protein V1778_04015 [bacterium]
MRQIAACADSHLMNNPEELSAIEARLQHTPYLAQRSWVPLSLIQWAIRKMRRTSLACLDRFRSDPRVQQADQLFTLGDQCHGIRERGIFGEPGRLVAQDFLCRLEGVARRFPAIHVPSEHMLGYWEGEDYLPRIALRRPHLRFRVIHRDIGGGMDMGAIANWQQLFGPLWGVRDIEGFRIIWIDCDLIRWRRRINESIDLQGLASLLDQQTQFLDATLSESRPDSVILLSHRLSSIFADLTILHFQDRLRAVMFADFHVQKEADRGIATLPSHSFATWFVPSVWGVQFGKGDPGFATLTIDGRDTMFRQHLLS